MALIKRAWVAMARDDVDVTPSARTVLLWMAMVAKDGDDPPRYFMRREESVVALGRTVPDAVSQDDPNYAEVTRAREAAFRRLQEAFGSLVDAGLIRRSGGGYRNRTAEFELLLSSTALAERETETVTLLPTETVGKGRRFPSEMPDGNRPPKEEGGQTEEYRRGNPRPNRPPHLNPVEKSA